MVYVYKYIQCSYFLISFSNTHVAAPHFSFWEPSICYVHTKLAESWKCSRDRCYSFFSLERGPWRKPGNWCKETRSLCLARARWAMVTILSSFRTNSFHGSDLLVDNFGFSKTSRANGSARIRICQ